MHEAFWNGLFDTRWEDAPLGREAVRLVLWLRERGYAERTRRDYGHAVVHLGRVLHEAHAEAASRALDEAIVEDFVDQHLPACRCYHQRPGRRADAARRGLTHLLTMLREQGVIPPLVSDRPPYHELLDGGAARRADSVSPPRPARPRPAHPHVQHRSARLGSGGTQHQGPTLRNTGPGAHPRQGTQGASVPPLAGDRRRASRVPQSTG